VQAIGARASSQRRSPGRNSSLTGTQKKSKCDLGGRRGRLISASDRATAIMLIEEATLAGAREKMACIELEISQRTLQEVTRESANDLPHQSICK